MDRRCGEKHTRDPPRKEPPQHDRISGKAKGIPEDELRAQSPPEEAKVRWVAQVSVQPGRDELVLICLPVLDYVVEVRAGLHHGDRSNDLADQDHSEAGGDEHGGAGRRDPAAVGEETVGDETFEKGRGVGNLVGRAVLRQQV